MKLLIAIVVLGVLGLVGVVIGLALDDTSPARSASGKADVFQGVITNVAVDVGEVQGIGAYDWNCTGIDGGQTQCDGGMRTEEYGILNFNYVHKMEETPCIAPGDRLRVTILDTKGQALVERRN